MKCEIAYHKPTPKQRRDMGKCGKGHELKCGPFYHAVCPECDASLSRRCGICQQPVYACSC